MYDTGTVFGGDVVAGDDLEGSLARVHPREEGFVLQSYEVGAFAAPDNLRFQRFAFLIHSAKFFGICRETCFGEDDNLSPALSTREGGRLFDRHIIDLRTHAKGGVGRQSPWGRRPGDDI